MNSIVNNIIIERINNYGLCEEIIYQQFDISNTELRKYTTFICEFDITQDILKRLGINISKNNMDYAIERLNTEIEKRIPNIYLSIIYKYFELYNIDKKYLYKVLSYEECDYKIIATIKNTQLIKDACDINPSEMNFFTQKYNDYIINGIWFDNINSVVNEELDQKNIFIDQLLIMSSDDIISIYDINKLIDYWKQYKQESINAKPITNKNIDKINEESITICAKTIDALQFLKNIITKNHKEKDDNIHKTSYCQTCKNFDIDDEYCPYIKSCNKTENEPSEYIKK